jgi:ABC-2 type transport system permease protein
MTTTDQAALTHWTEATRPRSWVFPAVARSEWTKLRSVRSTYWTLLAATFATVALASFISVRYVQMYPNVAPQDRVGFDATLFSLSGIYLAQIAFGALGVLVITSEYTTGMIRTSLAAIPQRRIFLAAKVVVFGILTFLLGEVIAFTSFGISQAILSHQHIGVSLGDPQVARAVIGAGLYLTGVSLLALGIGALIRNTAGALSAFFATMFAANLVVDLLPTTWRNHVINFLPANAGSQIFTIYPSHGALTPWTGLAVFCVYPLIALTVAFILINRFDA